MKTAFERLVAARPPAIQDPVDEELLDRIAASEPPRRRRPRLVIGIAFAAVLVVAGGIAVATQKTPQKPPQKAPEISVVAHVQKAMSRQDYVVRLHTAYSIGDGRKVETTTWSDAATGSLRTSNTVAGDRTDFLKKDQLATVVSYRDRSWWQFRLVPHTEPPVGIELAGPPDTPEKIKAALASGAFRVEEGKQPTVNGHRTVQLSSTRPDPVLGSFTIWVDASSYLPVRIRGNGDAKIRFVGSDIDWLPRTSANLVNLQLPIPAGFRHVQSPIEPKPPANGGVG